MLDEDAKFRRIIYCKLSKVVFLRNNLKNMERQMDN